MGVVSFYARQCRLIREAIREVKPNGRFDCLDVGGSIPLSAIRQGEPTILVRPRA